MMATMGRDTRTRWQGVFARHRKGCAVEDGRKCSCRPSYYGVVYDREQGKHRKTRMQRAPLAARNARADLVRALDAGELPERSDLRLGEAIDRFVRAARDGVALNKHGGRYKPSAIADLEQTLRQHVEAQLGRQRRLRDIRRGDCQRMVDELVGDGLSGSRVRSVVNATRSLYRFARARELVAHDPAQDVELPALDSQPSDRVASPGELRGLVDALPLADALPYAIAAYATARRAEIQTLRWHDVDLGAGSLVLGADPEARKYGASLRTVPILAPLAALLRRRWLELGRPADGLVCPPGRHAKTGRLSSTALAKRARIAWGWRLVEREGDRPRAWVKARPDALAPITLQECRHTAASWMDAAGVPPATRSRLMGHSLRLEGAAAVTSRYTHTLPGDAERAREQLDEFIAERESQEAEAR